MRWGVKLNGEIPRVPPLYKTLLVLLGMPNDRAVSDLTLLHY